MIALGIVGPGANAAKFCGRRITPDAILLVKRMEMKACCMRPQIICSRFAASRTKPLIAHCKRSAQTSISRFSHTGSLPVPAAFMPRYSRVLDEACIPSPLPDHV